jgi:hypothetical protein
MVRKEENDFHAMHDDMLGMFSSINTIKKKCITNFKAEQSRIDTVFDTIKTTPLSSEMSNIVKEYVQTSLESLDQQAEICTEKSMYDFVDNCNEKNLQLHVNHLDQYAINTCLNAIAGEIKEYLDNN